MKFDRPVPRKRLTKVVSRLTSIKPPVAALAVMAVVGVVGAVLTLSSNAATYTTSIEAESGQRSGNTSAGPTTGASGNASVTFGSAQTGGGGAQTGGPVGGDGPADPSNCSATAADTLKWGEPQYQSNFNTPTLDPTWHPYGPEPGHNKQGTRTPDAITLSDGNAVITADGKGKTGAMKWFPGQKYGRWEVCMKVKNGQQHYVLLTWPDAEDYPVGGELDFAEESGGAGKQTFFLHCPTSSGGNCATGSVNNDATQWTAYAMEWTPDSISGYVNGKEFFRSTNKSYQPPRSMNLCIQLDWFGKSSGEDNMTVDWAKQYSIPQSVPGTLGLKPGEASTGQPRDYPDRKPRPLTVQQMRGLAQ